MSVLNFYQYFDNPKMFQFWETLVLEKLWS